MIILGALREGDGRLLERSIKKLMTFAFLWGYKEVIIIINSNFSACNMVLSENSLSERLQKMAYNKDHSCPRLFNFLMSSLRMSENWKKFFKKWLKYVCCFAEESVLSSNNNKTFLEPLNFADKRTICKYFHYPYWLHFTDEEPEAPRGKVTCQNVQS